jgi:cell division protein FtsB
MAYIKKTFIKILFFAEIIVCGHLYLFGNNGITTLQNQKNIVINLKQEITQLQNNIIQLKEEIHTWNNDDFYKEKIAREQLQMARKGDELFYIGT